MASANSPRGWHGPPVELMTTWGDVFDRSRTGLDLTEPCPVCGARNLHRWFDLHRRDEKRDHGIEWQGRGSQWQWCSSCLSYLHSSGLVPTWWISDLQVPESELCHDPGPIEVARTRRDPP